VAGEVSDEVSDQLSSLENVLQVQTTSREQ